MTITMTSKNQITIPNEIAKILGLKKGALFNIELRKNRIELVPVEVREREFSDEVYEKLDILYDKEKGRERKVTAKFVNSLKKKR